MIKDGETKGFEINTGENEIYAKIDWCETSPMKLSIKENDIIKLELGSNIKGWKLLLSMYYITLNTSEYLFLKKSPVKLIKIRQQRTVVKNKLFSH